MADKSTIKEEIDIIVSHLIEDRIKYETFINYNSNLLYRRDFYEVLKIKPRVKKNWCGWTSLERFIYNIRDDAYGLSRSVNGFGSQLKYAKIKERILNEYNKRNTQ